MGIRLGDAYVEISGDDRKLVRALASAKGKTVSFMDTIRGFMERWGHRIFDGMINGLRSVVSAMSSAVNASSDLNETISKTAAVFGSSAQGVYEWSKTSAEAMGLSQRAALDVVSGMGNMFIQLGANRDQAISFSQEMVGLSADIASFNNVAGGAEEVLADMRSAFIGEFDPIQKYIPTINAAAVAQRALAMTGKESAQSLTQLDKAMAVQELIITGAGAAVGDFARTSKDLANSQRIAAASLEGFSARIGNAFRPAMTSILNQLIDIGKQVEPYAEQIVANIARGLASAIRYILPALMTLRNLFVYWLKPGSPPRLLPNIDEWGRDTMRVWLDGMSSIDVKAALGTVGAAVENILRSFVASGKMKDTSLVSSVLGSRDAIADAVAEFKQFGSVSESTIARITRSAGPAGNAITKLVTTYFDLQRASEKVKLAQDALNRATEQYDRILNPLRDSLDDVRGQQQALANQQRLIAAQNTVNNFEATAAEKQAARLEIQQIALEDQISLEEQKRDAALETAQAEVDTATQAEEAAQLQFDAAQATIDRQVETNNLLAEEMRLQEQLAAARKQQAEAALREAEAAANEQQQLAEDARREQEQLNDAILDYQMQLADTPGKIALMRGELAKTTVGSVEYYSILTQISSLEKQLANEREAAAKAGAAAAGAAGLPALPTFDTGTIEQEVGGLATAANELKVALDEVFAVLRTVTPEDKTRIKEVGDTFVRIVGVVKALVNGDWATAWSLYKQHATSAYTEVDTDTETKLGRLKGMFSFFQYATNLSWSKYWEDWGKIWTLATGGILTGVGTWFTDLDTKFRNWIAGTQKAMSDFFRGFGDSFRNAGKAATDGFFDGLKSGWVAIDTWFKDKLQAMKNLLPFSEPKDPSSPLRDLGKSGESMINMIHEGMQRATSDFNSTVSGLSTPAMSMAGGTTSTTNLGGISVSVNVTGTGQVSDVRVAAETGVLSALRAAGVSL